jgi:hypothetical protein
MTFLKKSILALSLVSFCFFGKAQESLLQTPAAVGLTTLSWNYPTSELNSNLLFKIRGTTNLSLAKTNWPIITNIVGTITNTTVQIPPGAYYFTMTASNLWGETIPSNVEATPALPRSDFTVRVVKIQ